MMTAHLLPNEENIKKGDDDYFSLVGFPNEALHRFWPLESSDALI